MIKIKNALLFISGSKSSTDIDIRMEDEDFEPQDLLADNDNGSMTSPSSGPPSPSSRPPSPSSGPPSPIAQDPSSKLTKKQKRCRLDVEDPAARLKTCSVKYYFDVHGERRQVCRSTFMDVLGETDGFVRSAVEKKKINTSGIAPPDGRGRRAPAHKLLG